MKKLIALVLAVVLLAGCQLASDEVREDPMQDKLVGVFITFENLRLFDIEAYLEENADSFVDGGEVTLDAAESSRYQDRIYAVMEEDGGYSFPGLEGIYLCQKWEEDHWAGFATEGICDIKTHSTRTDTEDRIEESGTIYVPSGLEEAILFANPVYMTPGGQYYLVEGQGASTGTIDQGSLSVSVDDEKTWTEDGVEYVYSASYEVIMQGVDVPGQVALVHMSADNRELHRAEYLPEELPETVEPAEGAAYVILEESVGGKVTRTIHQPGGDKVCVFVRAEHDICLPRYAEILWPEG